MREVVDGIVYDTRGAQFVAGFRTRRGGGGGGGGGDRRHSGRVESGSMYVMAARGKKRVFMVEKPMAGEAVVEPVDAGTARVVLEEWRVRGCITEEAARLAAVTLDMVAPVEEQEGRRPADTSDNGRDTGGAGDTAAEAAAP